MLQFSICTFWLITIKTMQQQLSFLTYFDHLLSLISVESCELCLKHCFSLQWITILDLSSIICAARCTVNGKLELHAQYKATDGRFWTQNPTSIYDMSGEYNLTMEIQTIPLINSFHRHAGLSKHAQSCWKDRNWPSDPEKETAMEPSTTLIKFISTSILCCSPNPVSACLSSFLSMKPELSLS